MAEPEKRKPGRPKLGKIPKDRPLSIRSVIEPEELRFVRLFLSFGKRDAAEAYRRAFLRKNRRGKWIDLERGGSYTDEEIRDAPEISSDTAGKRANSLLKSAHIQDTLYELQRTPSEHARQTLMDQVLFGTATEKKEAVKQILSDEDKLGFKDASEKFWEISCQIGQEVVIPLGEIQRDVRCKHCHETTTVTIDLAQVVPTLEFFSQNGDRVSGGEAPSTDQPS